MSAPASNPQGDQNTGKDTISFGSYRFVMSEFLKDRFSDTMKTGGADESKAKFTLGGVVDQGMCITV